MPNLINLPPFTEDGDVYVVVETPRGSRAKFDYDPKLKTFTLSKSLLTGLTYPHDWGFVPSTKANDGTDRYHGCARRRDLSGRMANSVCAALGAASTLPGVRLLQNIGNLAARHRVVFNGVEACQMSSPTEVRMIEAESAFLPHEVQYWADKFNVSKERLSEAVKNVGHSAAAVERELKRLA